MCIRIVERDRIVNTTRFEWAVDVRPYGLLLR